MRHGLVPGHNVDRLDVAAGLRELEAFCTPSLETRAVVEYALVRWARGEEVAAQRGAIDKDFHGIDLTGWYRVLAAARAAAEAPAERVGSGQLYMTNKKMLLCPSHAEEVGQERVAVVAACLYGGCQMCRTQPVEGNVCYRDACRKPLHKQWPAVYCSNECALLDT